MHRPSRPQTVLLAFGTRPELIKLAPVVQALAHYPQVRPVVVSSGQHADLLPPLRAWFDLRVDHDLRLMTTAQTPTQFCARWLAALDPILAAERPDLVLVQGDTSTAWGAALTAFHRRIPVGHVEAGLRSGDADCPFPEEMHRRLITRLATLHFAATHGNRDTLLGEGVAPEHIVVTGNPVVDAVRSVLARPKLSHAVGKLLAATAGRKRLLLTTHRRESLGAVMTAHLRVLRDFVAAHDNVVLLFPVHPNPEVRRVAADVLGRRQRVRLLPPLNYGDFIGLMARAWLVVSDSGGVQEEAPSLGVPLLLLRRNTERPEAVACGCARLIGDDPRRLRRLLEEAYQGGADSHLRRKLVNPFGTGDSGRRIAAGILEFLGLQPPSGDGDRSGRRARLNPERVGTSRR